MTALYVLFAEVFLYREIPLRRLPGITREAMVMVGGASYSYGIVHSLLYSYE